MTKIELNGAPQTLQAPTSVAALLEANGYAGRTVAVEINREIVPRSLHAQRFIADGDRIEIVKAMGGG
jgi:sulfur carrier protein